MASAELLNDGKQIRNLGPSPSEFLICDVNDIFQITTVSLNTVMSTAKTCGYRSGCSAATMER